MLQYKKQKTKDLINHFIVCLKTIAKMPNKNQLTQTNVKNAKKSN